MKGRMQMIQTIKADERHFSDFGWLKTYWLFSFDNYYDPANLQFAYGTPKYADDVRKLIRLGDNGAFALDMDYFSYHHSPDTAFNAKFERLFGAPRDPKSHFFTQLSGYPAYFGDKPANYAELCRQNQHYADIASRIQLVTEETLLTMALALHAKTGLPRLCMAGGVALNSVANGRILRETPFGQFWLILATISFISDW